MLFRSEVFLALRLCHHLLGSCTLGMFWPSCSGGIGFSFFSGSSREIWDKVFESGPSKTCGRQPLKHLKGSRSNFLKAVFHNFYLVHSSIICPIWTREIEEYEFFRIHSGSGLENFKNVAKGLYSEITQEPRKIILNYSRATQNHSNCSSILITDFNTTSFTK